MNGSYPQNVFLYISLDTSYVIILESRSDDLAFGAAVIQLKLNV